MQCFFKAIFCCVIVLGVVFLCQAADLKQRKPGPSAPVTQTVPATPARKPVVPHPTPDPPQATTGKKTVSGFDFSTKPAIGTTGIRTAAGFDFSTQATPGTTGIRIVTGFDFSTQPTPGTTGIRTVQGFDFIKQ